MEPWKFLKTVKFGLAVYALFAEVLCQHVVNNSTVFIAV